MENENHTTPTAAKPTASSYLHSKSKQIDELGEFTTFPQALIEGFEQIDDAQPTDEDRSRMTGFHSPTSLGFWKYRMILSDGSEIFVVRHAWDRCKTNLVEPDGNQLVFYAPGITESAAVSWLDAR